MKRETSNFKSKRTSFFLRLQGQISGKLKLRKLVQGEENEEKTTKEFPTKRHNFYCRTRQNNIFLHIY